MGAIVCMGVTKGAVHVCVSVSLHVGACVYMSGCVCVHVPHV